MERASTAAAAVGGVAAAHLLAVVRCCSFFAWRRWKQPHLFRVDDARVVLLFGDGGSSSLESVHLFNCFLECCARLRSRRRRASCLIVCLFIYPIYLVLRWLYDDHVDGDDEAR